MWNRTIKGKIETESSENFKGSCFFVRFMCSGSGCWLPVLTKQINISRRFIDASIALPFNWRKVDSSVFSYTETNFEEINHFASTTMLSPLNK